MLRLTNRPAEESPEAALVVVPSRLQTHSRPHSASSSDAANAHTLNAATVSQQDNVPLQHSIRTECTNMECRRAQSSSAAHISASPESAGASTHTECSCQQQAAVSSLDAPGHSPRQRGQDTVVGQSRQPGTRVDQQVLHHLLKQAGPDGAGPVCMQRVPE